MPADIESILKIEVPLIVQVASRVMPVAEVMSIAPGTIVELPKLADEELEVLVNNKQIGLGRAVKVGENFGIRISFVGDLEAKIAAMSENRPQIAETKEDEELTDNEAEDLAAMLLAGQL